MSSPEAARVSPTLNFPAAKVKMETSESFDSQKTNSSASTVSNSTFRNPLIKKENLTATKLTTIFANSAATPPPVAKGSQTNSSPSSSPNSNTNTTNTNTNTNAIPIQNNYRGRIIGKEPAGPQLPPKHHPKIQPSTHKYPKIQPQIAPKPIAVLPKPSSFSPVPNPNVKTSLMMSAPTSSDKTSLNINTSKRWVLPPRPRPGRKPTASAETDDKSKAIAVAKVSPKKRPKIKKETVEKQVVGTVNGVPVSKSVVSGTIPSNSSITHTGPSTLSSASVNSATVKSQDPRHDFIDAKSGLSSDVDKRQILAQLQQQYSQASNGRASSPLSTTSVSIPPSVSNSPSNKHSPSISSPSSVPTSSSASPLSSQLPLPPIVSKNDPKSEIANLKMSYLSKLKEQELIRNYIEVITNQIKELSFVQNGMITFDALRTNSTSTGKSKRVNSPSTISKSTSYDQLESISNLNDLNKFLNYLTKSSSIIHSATKRSSASNQSSNSDTVINSQIDHYLEIRSKFKSMKTEELKRLNNLRKQKNSMNGVLPTSVVAGTSLSSNGDLATAGRSSSFTPDLLKPLKASTLFDPDGDQDIVIDILGEDNTIGGNLVSADNNALTSEDIDIFMEENDFLNRLILNDDVDNVGIPPNADLLKEQESSLRVKIHDKNEPVVQDSLLKKKSKLNCGFCTNDTPCLCFDADFDIGILRH